MSVGTTAIIEMDAERDRKTCLALDLKVAGANRELAGWLGCGVTRIKELRVWAQDGFNGSPSKRADRRRAADAPLESLENYEEQDETADVADASTVEDNALYTLARMVEHARIFKKFFKLSSFDREAEVRIMTAIDRMIEKWRSTQATLTKRGKDHR
jgi:hypothetical protein